jgi:hypothetical protein
MIAGRARVKGREQALNGRRKSLPSLLMVSRDVTKVPRERYPSERATQTYLRELQAISRTRRTSQDI